MTGLLPCLMALALAALLGFAADRAGICAVKAVAEVITTGRPHMLASFAKTVLWVMALMLPVMWLLPGHREASLAWPTAISIAGGAIFGVGAAVNGGCAVSTLTRLGNGDLAMLVTIGGIAAALAAVDGGLLAVRVDIMPAPAIRLAVAGWPLAAAVVLLWAWAGSEATRLWRRRDPTCSTRDFLVHRRWRLSTAAAVIGLANAVIGLAAGHWAYTGTLRQFIRWTTAGAMRPSTVAIALFVALMGGIIASSLLRGSFRLHWRPTLGWLRHLGGGVLMGVGVLTVPGGNDALILEALPALSPHAVPAFAAMLGGIGAILLILRRFTLAPRIDCRGDLCSEGEQAAAD